MKRLAVKEMIRHQMGNDLAQLLPNPEPKVRAVCKTCNNGWMHALEESNIPLIGSLMQDVAFSLNGLQQYQVATWAVKMSMIGDFLARSHRALFLIKPNVNNCELQAIYKRWVGVDSIASALPPFSIG